MPPQYSVQPNPRVSFEVTYEDEHLIILNKPSSVVTQPGEKHQHDALLNGAFDRWGKQLQNLGKKRDFGLLHRLDRGTSGLVIIAHNRLCYDQIRAQFEQRLIKKTYWTMASGQPKQRRGQCSTPIAEVRSRGKKRAITVPSPSSSYGQSAFSSSAPHAKVNSKMKLSSQHRRREGHNRGPSRVNYQANSHRIPVPQEAVTRYRVLESHQSSLGPVAFLECQPQTGRLHQIRVHLRTLNMTVIGDFDYGGSSDLNRAMRSLGRDRLMLHAGRLEFVHPVSQEALSVQVPIPSWWSDVTQKIQVPPCRST